MSAASKPTTTTVVYDEEFLKEVETSGDKKFMDNEWPKLKQAAEVHGYRGASKGKHNGIVIIRPSDKGLLKTLQKLVIQRKRLHPPSDKTIPIKVVAHVPSGNRLVGLRSQNGHIYIYGVANYAD
jgi:hypothetical protein